jgi:hypothetical protein
LADSPGKWGKLIGLSGWQWSVVAGSPFVLLLTWARLRTGGYGKTLAAVRPASESRLSPPDRLALAQGTAWALAVVVKYGPWKPNCLLRSLALGWFLGRKGIPFEIQIGVPGGNAGVSDGSEPDFSAHAWLELDGVVLNDRQDIAAEFSPFNGRGKL